MYNSHRTEMNILMSPSLPALVEGRHDSGFNTLRQQEYNTHGYGYSMDKPYDNLSETDSGVFDQDDILSVSTGEINEAAINMDDDDYKDFISSESPFMGDKLKTHLDLSELFKKKNQPSKPDDSILEMFDPTYSSRPSTKLNTTQEVYTPDFEPTEHPVSPIQALFETISPNISDDTEDLLGDEIKPNYDGLDMMLELFDGRRSISTRNSLPNENLVSFLSSESESESDSETTSNLERPPDTIEETENLNGSMLFNKSVNSWHQFARDEEEKNFSHRIYVDNLPNDMEDNELVEIFRNKQISISKATIVRDQDGISKGFGEVDVPDSLQFNRTMAMDGMKLRNGMKLKVTPTPIVREEQAYSCQNATFDIDKILDISTEEYENNLSTPNSDKLQSGIPDPKQYTQPKTERSHSPTMDSELNSILDDFEHSNIQLKTDSVHMNISKDVEGDDLRNFFPGIQKMKFSTQYQDTVWVKFKSVELARDALNKSGLLIKGEPVRVHPNTANCRAFQTKKSCDKGSECLFVHVLPNSRSLRSSVSESSPIDNLPAQVNTWNDFVRTNTAHTAAVEKKRHEKNIRTFPVHTLPAFRRSPDPDLIFEGVSARPPYYMKILEELFAPNQEPIYTIDEGTEEINVSVTINFGNPTEAIVCHAHGGTIDETKEDVARSMLHMLRNQHNVQGKWDLILEPLTSERHMSEPVSPIEHYNNTLNVSVTEDVDFFTNISDRFESDPNLTPSSSPGYISPTLTDTSSISIDQSPTSIHIPRVPKVISVKVGELIRAHTMGNIESAIRHDFDDTAVSDESDTFFDSRACDVSENTFELYHSDNTNGNLPHAENYIDASSSESHDPESKESTENYEELEELLKAKAEIEAKLAKLAEGKKRLNREG